MADHDFSQLRALFFNCTLTRSPGISNTQGLIDVSAGIMKKHNVDVEVIRAVDRDIATGGIPAYGNQRPEWDKGERFDFVNPEYR